MPRQSPKTVRYRSSGDRYPNSPLNITAALGETFTETKRGKDFVIRKTLDGQSVYKCPGCNNSIAIGQPSYTVIEQNHIFGEQAAIDDRRHWHLSCWKRYS